MQYHNCHHHWLTCTRYSDGKQSGKGVGTVLIAIMPIMLASAVYACEGGRA